MATITDPSTPAADAAGWVNGIHIDPTAGSLDTSFDGPSGSGNGKFTLSVSGGNDFFRFVTQSDGKIVGVGDAGSDLVVARFNEDGTLDASFDGPAGSSGGNDIFTLNVSSTD